MSCPQKYFLLLFLFIPGIIFSQSGHLHVVKDNSACLYGLKNDSGKWVVPAQYTSINTQNNWIDFIVMSGNKYGVMSGHGKIIIPVSYDKIETIGYPKTYEYILTSNKKCGIVDSSNNPITPMIYDRISLNGRCGGYIVQQNDKFGLLGGKGKMKLPLEYSNITNDDHGDGYFLARKKDEKSSYNYVGYGDSSGIVIPCMYKQLVNPYQYYDKQHKRIFVALDSSKYSSYGLIGSKNEIIIPFIYNSIWVSEQYNNNGKELIYRIVVEQQTGYNNKTYGVFDSDGKQIIPPGTQVVYNNSNGYGENFPFNPTDTMAAKQNEKWGLLTGNNEWVTAQDFDSIIVPEYVPHATTLRWIVEKNKKFGTLNAKGKIFFPIVFDLLMEISDNSNYGYDNFSDDIWYFFGKKNGKFGSIDSNGKEWIPFVYDTIIENGSVYYFTNKTDALYFERYQYSNYYVGGPGGVFPLKFQFRINDSLLVYSFDYRYFVFEDSTMKGKMLLNTAIEINRDNNNDNLINVVSCQPEKYGFDPAYNSYRYFSSCDTLTFNKAGKLQVNPLRGIDIAGYYKDDIIFRKDNKLGLISKKGKIIRPPIYYGFQPMDYNDRSCVWIKFAVDSSCPFYGSRNYDCPCGWTLCDSLERPLLNTKFDYPFIFVTNLQTVFVNGKAGLFDILKKRFVTSCRFTDIKTIYPNTGNNDQYSWRYNDPTYGKKKLFYAIRDNGEFGVIDSTGKWVSDSTFTEMMPVPRRNHMLCQSTTTDAFVENRNLFTGRNSEMIMDENGRMAKDSLLIDSLLAQTFVLKDFRYGYYWVGEGGGDNTPNWVKQGPAITAEPYSKNIDNSNWNDSLVGDAMRFSQQLLMKKYNYLFANHPSNNYFKCFCTTSSMSEDYRNPNNVEIRYPFAKNKYYNNHLNYYSENTNLWKNQITFLAPQGFSLQLEFNPDSSLAAKKNPAPFYLNFRKSKTGFVPCTLDSIFCPTVNYPVILNNLILEAISKRDDLNLDCNNPQSYYFLSHGRFCFTKDGLQFFIESKGTFTVVIPWKELQPYSRPGGIVDDFVGNSLGEHCKPPLDSSVIDYKFQNYNRVNDFLNSDFLKREKVKNCTYIFEDSKISGMKFCCEGNVEYDVYFKSVKSAADANCNTATTPRKIRNRQIIKMICIKNCPCG